MSVTIERNVPFGTATSSSGQELLCNVFTPPESAAPFPDLPGGLRAGILVIHGGGWTDGEKEQLEGYAILLGRKGYVCVTNSYRMASDPTARTQANPDHFAAEESKWPAMLHDCKAAVRWMRANAGDLSISPDHIAVTGNSAGGHLSLMVAGVDGTLYPELEGDSGSAGVSSAVQACGAVYPVTIASPHKSVLNPIGRDGSRHIDRTVMPAGSTSRDLVMFSPLTYASADFPPTCFLHGNGDTLVGTDQSFKMYEELNSRGAHAEMHMFASAPHGFDADPRLARQCIDLLGTFFDRIFRPENYAFSIDASTPGDAFVDMDGSIIRDANGPAKL